MFYGNQYTLGLKQKKSLSQLSWNRVKDRILKERGRKCQLCGWDEINLKTKLSPVDIHHIDGDKYNNLESNLIILCPNCHSLTENYKHCRKHSEETKKKISSSLLK